ncbi:MAG TPA: radical SAM family heme chaperone HemW [Tissierellaceae bacterium]|nr:radical SAM family heme chaperone HemW [Tissierellaceae bacterium]
MKSVSLYIHIPFCVSKCYYCDFSSFANMEDKIEDYMNSLVIELDLYKEKLEDYNIKTIFIGGGTPTSIDPKHIAKLLAFITNNFNLKDNIEISIEGNPGTLNREKVQIYKKAGINRFSLGLQSLNDDLLKSIGRSHNVEDFYNSYNLLKHMGINNINVDLMFGLPNQSLEDVVSTLDKVLKLGVEHISYYGLILEEETYLYDIYHKGLVSLPSEDEEREMYHTGRKILEENGYIHYEISNFALPGYECKHNLVYWDLMPYIGIGLSSHSSFKGKRFWNTKNMSLYIEKLGKKEFPITGEEIINRATEISEFCILGIRKIKGIDKLEFNKRFNTKIETLYGDIINKHEENGLINNQETFISLTNKGLDLSNIVEVDFLIYNSK